MRYLALDFETGNASPLSACALGASVFEDNQLVDEKISLIRPPENRYAAFNIGSHGITPEDTAEAPDFAAVWPELAAYLAGRVVVAHNARFDMGVLASCLAEAGLRAPTFSYADTVAIARKAWPDLENHKLGTVGAFLGIDFHHHNALEDARA